MSNHGFQTLFGLWPEPAPLAEPVTAAIRPAGISAAFIATEPVTVFANTNAFGQEAKAQTLHAFPRLTITRAYQPDTFTDWMLDAMRTSAATVEADTPTAGKTRTTRQTRIDTGLVTFGADFALADGQTKRLRGMTPQRIAYTFETGKLVGQSVEFIGLHMTDIDPSEARTANPPAPQNASPLHCTFALGLGENTEPEPAPAFTLSLLFDRALTASQFDEDGNPSRFDVASGWRATGTGTARLTAYAAQQLSITGEALTTMQITIDQPGALLRFQMPRARASVLQHGALSDFVHATFDFIGLSADTTPTLYTVTEK